MPTGHEYDKYIMSLAESALAQPAETREGFLDSACDGDRLIIEDVQNCLQQLSQTDAAAPVHDFSPGTVLADRFRIVRLVGAGGMGLVYEAIDQTLDRRVAIKCAKASHQMSLPPEARVAREVSHFNVCKVHDLHTTTTTSGEVNFLSMEFIQGETLSGRIRRDGPLPPAEALGIALQICAGLAQAHRQGVIHADLKVGNVILAKTADGGTRAVITDFGLGRFAAPDGSRIASPRGGTRDYMAPELLLGERASVLSDLYALGVLFHVMLTGRPPAWTKTADGDSGPASKPPRPPTPDATTATMFTRIVETDWKRRMDELPRPWRQIIGKCLEPNPVRRFASAQLVGEALEPQRRFLKWGAAAVVAVAALGYWQWQAPAPGPAVRLAVLPFTIERDAGTGDAAVALDIAERLSGARRNFSVITPLEAKQNQVDTPEKARTILGATHVLKTRLTRGAGGKIGAEAQLVDLESGNALRVLKSVYPAGDTAALAKALIGTVTVGLNLKSRTPQEPVAGAAYPSYIDGLNALAQDVHKAEDAIQLLERAITLDSRSASPYAALALAQLQRFRNGDGRQWLDRATEAAGKAAGINPDSVQVLFASGQVDQLSGRYEQALAAFNRAATLDPGNQGVWRMLAETYQLAGRDEDAVRIYRKAIEAQPGGYLPYMNFGNYYLARGQYRQAEEMYRNMTVFAPGLSSGHMNLGLALKQQGRYSEAEQSLLKAQSLRSSPRLLLNLGALYYEQERYAEALRLFQESAKLGQPSALLHRNLGDAFRHLARSREAANEYRAARTLAEVEVTVNPRSADGRARLALLSARLGETHRASYELSQALAMVVGNPAPVIANAVQTFEVLKQRDRAIELLQKAPRSLLEELGRVPDLIALRQDRRFQELLHKP